MTSVFDTLGKQNLMFGSETFVCHSRNQTFPVVLDQVCTHCSRDFGPVLHTDLLQILQVSELSLSNMDFQLLQRFSIGFRYGDWLGHSRTLRCFLWSHSLVVLAVCFGSLSIFNVLTERRRLLAEISRYMAPSILPSIRCSRPLPFAENISKE
ncbi:hypothetical protein AMECASPLE_039270 [Ameca splendens]|uniref:Uncharacterized protein n=1 Tax=Ameca splendens TaxID=208324 RepID=A0ABV0Y8B7_9TELE